MKPGDINKLAEHFGWPRNEIVKVLESDEEEHEGRVVVTKSASAAAADGRVSELTGDSRNSNHDPKEKGQPNTPARKGGIAGGIPEESPFSLLNQPTAADDEHEEFDDLNGDDELLNGPVLSPPAPEDERNGGGRARSGARDAAGAAAARILAGARTLPEARNVSLRKAIAGNEQSTAVPVPVKQPRSRAHHKNNNKRNSASGHQQDSRSARNKIQKIQKNQKNPAPPKTPDKKRKQSPSSTISPARLSPKEREHAQMLDDPCDHKIENFVKEVQPSYFTPLYQKKNKYMAEMCGDCKTQLGPEGYKVGQRQPVYLCENAKKHSHICKLGFCEPCYKKRLMANSSNKKDGEPANTQAECHHKEYGTYSEDSNASYYVQSYYDKNTNSASHCAECQKKFGPKGYKVRSSAPVYLCENAKSLYHTCKHAYCKNCYLDKMLNAGNDAAAAGRGRRSSRRSRGGC